MSTDNKPDPNIIKLENVRLSFPDLFTPRAMEEGKEKTFNATFLLDNEKHAKLITKIEAAIERVALDEFKKKITLKDRNKCLHDGNESPDTEGYGDGVMFLRSKNKTRPPVVNRDLSPITEADGIVYPGCFVNATVRLFAWDHPTGGKGVSASLRAIQFVKDGESFGAGKVDVENEFKSLEEEVDDI
jgi:hypothetical protein